jgi:TolB-like protein/class 3 adenylate cyclase/Tfp pilus assembly protein PilF
VNGLAIGSKWKKKRFPKMECCEVVQQRVDNFQRLNNVSLLFLLGMRQLVAIVFADMSGYTALMQENEQLATLKRKRLKEVLDATLQKFDGKIIQYYGDGSLSIFKSAVDAVGCAVSIQQQLQESPHVELRIGIHTGDVTMDDDAIYGDSVNLASRIESIAVSGSILISEKVYDELKNQNKFKVREVGIFEFKNVKRPVRVYAIANEGIVIPQRAELSGKTKHPTNRLAVLPFVNMSADPENEYFSDGITEEILNALTKVKGLQITSRTSSFAFKGKNDDIRDIAIKLNVDKILEGSVRRAGNRVRITAQLINAADGYHIWSESYDRNLTDIFEVQDEISGIITNKLRANFTGEQDGAVKVPTRNVQAYTSYLKGLHYWNRLTPADTNKAIECFEKAFELEPDYAQAYAMAAGAYANLGATGQMLPDKAFQIVGKYADKALQLDEQVAEGHIAKGSYYLFCEWDWTKSYEALQRAIELNPGATTAYHLLSLYYVITGKKNQAVKIMEEAVRIDPLSPIINNALGNAYIFAEQYDDAIRQADKMLEMNPQMRVNLELKAWATGLKGDWSAALDIFLEVHRLTNHPLKGLMGVGYAYARLGMTDKALECIEKLERRQREDPESVIDADLIAIWYALGNKDKVFYHINQCIKKRLAPINYLLEYPVFKGLSDDPRYIAMKKAEITTE